MKPSRSNPKPFHERLPRGGEFFSALHSRDSIVAGAAQMVRQEAANSQPKQIGNNTNTVDKFQFAAQTEQYVQVSPAQTTQSEAASPVPVPALQRSPEFATGQAAFAAQALQAVENAHREAQSMESAE